MYCSELVRKKLRATDKIISPPRGISESLKIQIRKYANASGDKNILNTKANASVCCANTITNDTVIPGDVCEPTIQYPRGFYGPVRPDCVPVNNPPIVDRTKKCC